MKNRSRICVFWPWYCNSFTNKINLTSKNVSIAHLNPFSFKYEPKNMKDNDKFNKLSIIRNTLPK